MFSHVDLFIMFSVLFQDFSTIFPRSYLALHDSELERRRVWLATMVCGSCYALCQGAQGTDATQMQRRCNADATQMQPLQHPLQHVAPKQHTIYIYSVNVGQHMLYIVVLCQHVSVMQIFQRNGN